MHTHKLPHVKVLCTIGHIGYLHWPLQAKVLKTTPSISLFFFSLTKIAFFSIVDLGLLWNMKNKTEKSANAYKFQDEICDISTQVDFGTSSYKQVKSTWQRASSWHQQRLSSGSKEKTVPSKVSPILNPSWKTGGSDIHWGCKPTCCCRWSE